MYAVGPEAAQFLPCGLHGTCHRSGTSPEAIRQSRDIREAIREPIITHSQQIQQPGSHKFLFVRGLDNLIHICCNGGIHLPMLEYEIWRAVEHLAINRGERTLQLREENVATLIQSTPLAIFIKNPILKYNAYNATIQIGSMNSIINVVRCNIRTPPRLRVDISAFPQ